MIITDPSYELSKSDRLTNTTSTHPLNTDGPPQVTADGIPVINSRMEQYGYDEINGLTSVNYGYGGTQQYSFDNMGNRQPPNRQPPLPTGFIRGHDKLHVQCLEHVTNCRWK